MHAFMIRGRMVHLMGVMVPWDGAVPGPKSITNRWSTMQLAPTNHCQPGEVQACKKSATEERWEMGPRSGIKQVKRNTPATL